MNSKSRLNFHQNDCEKQINPYKGFDNENENNDGDNAFRDIDLVDPSEISH